MVSKIAEEIYARSIQLKKYNRRNLLFKKNRLTLEKELFEIQEKNDALLRKLYGNTACSIEHYELALFMSKILAECIAFLVSKGKNYRKTVARYIWGFHNLPRAFLRADHSMSITPDEAMAYYKPYLKSD